MMGISCKGTAYISGDNQSVLANTTILDSTLEEEVTEGGIQDGLVCQDRLVVT